jgi:hypothetical protein
VPPAADPSWESRAPPLLAFLSEPRTPDEIMVWADEQGKPQDLVRHTLAWLCLRGLARYDIDAKRWLVSYG